MGVIRNTISLQVGSPCSMLSLRLGVVLAVTCAASVTGFRFTGLRYRYVYGYIPYCTMQCTVLNLLALGTFPC